MKKVFCILLISGVLISSLFVMESVSAAICNAPRVCYEGSSCSDLLPVGGWRFSPDYTCEGNRICCELESSSPAPSSGQSSCSECLPGQICNPLSYCNIEDLIKAIVNDFLIPVSISVAAIMFVIAGIVLVTSAGDPGKARTARSIMIYTAVGLAVILAASGLIKVLQSLLGGS